MKKKVFIIVLLLSYLFNCINVDAFYDRLEYSGQGIGEVNYNGEEVYLSSYDNFVLIDKNDNFVLANFVDDNLKYSYFPEVNTNRYDYTYSYFDDREDCESYSANYISKVCNDEDYTLVENELGTYKKFPFGQPFTREILDFDCLDAEGEDRCYFDSFSRGDNYKNVENYQFIGMVRDTNVLYKTFNFTDEEKTKLDQLVNKYILDDENPSYKKYFDVYKEGRVTDVKLEMNDLTKDSIGTAKLVSSDPSNVDYIVFSIINKTGSVEEITVSDGWKMSTFEDSVYDGYDEAVRTFYSLKNIKKTSDSEIATIKLKANVDIDDETMLVGEYQQIEGVRALFKNNTDISYYGCGHTLFFYKGRGCDQPYSPKDQGYPYFRISNDLYYYPLFCNLSFSTDVVYRDAMIRFSSRDVNKNVNLIYNSTSIEKKAEIEDNPIVNPLTNNNDLVICLSVGIIIAFIIYGYLKSKRESYE